jgi:hypothetical protein
MQSNLMRKKSMNIQSLRNCLLAGALLATLQTALADSPFDHWHPRESMAQGNTLYAIVYDHRPGRHK